MFFVHRSLVFFKYEITLYFTFFIFKISAKGTLRQLYQVRANVDSSYGTASQRVMIHDEDHDIWKKSVAWLNRKDPAEHSMLIMI